jgi:hypothetical protein
MEGFEVGDKVVWAPCNQAKCVICKDIDRDASFRYFKPLRIQEFTKGDLCLVVRYEKDLPVDFHTDDTFDSESECGPWQVYPRHLKRFVEGS